MEPKDKQSRVIKAIQVKDKQLLRYALIGLGAVVVVAIIISLLIPSKTSRSNSLVNKVAHLQKTTQCKDGIKQIQPLDSALTSSNQYSSAAKEKGLNYLMNCSLLAGNAKQALVYANQLDAVYAQEGKVKEQQYLAGMKSYIQGFIQ